MKSLFATVAAVALFTSAAPAFAFDWNGFYTGVGLGYASSDVDTTWDTIPAPDFSMNPTGWFGGVTAGFNSSVGAGLVVGLEGDLSIADITETIDDPLTAGETLTSTTDWTGTLRGRVGFDAGDFMPYLTAGAVFAHASVSSTGPTGVEDDGVLAGGVIGAGVEAAVADNITIKGEALYSFFGDHTWFEGETFSNTSSPTSTAVRGGVNFHF
jgi:outer membrane immunogenic protein